jgi:hypothetical protein
MAAALSKLPATTPPAQRDLAYEARWANAVQQLSLHFDFLDAAVTGKRDGLIGRGDLQAAANNPGLPQALRDACRFLLDNPAAFYQLDTAAKAGKPDGLIGRHDIAAALLKPARPANALTIIDFSSMQVDLDRLWSASFPNGAAQEQGGTLVLDAYGNIRIVNMKSGTSNSISYDFNVGSGNTVIGVFHTHPYDSGVTGTFSGADIANLINDIRRSISIVQSGTEQFMLIKTDATPTSVDSAELSKTYSARIAELRANGESFSDALKIAARETAQAYGLAYYEGSNGIFHRVYPE